MQVTKRRHARLRGCVVGLLLAANAQGEVGLNEILADNRTTVSHDDTYPDYVELFNPSAQTANLGGMSLTDDLSQPRKYVFPANTRLAPGGCLLVWCDSQTNAPGLHTGFGLSNKGEEVGLYTTDGLLLDSLTFGLQLPDLALGRIPNGTGAWTLATPTPALPNTAQPLGPGTALKFNEWMASAAPDADWFELYNATNLPVALGELVFTDQLAIPPTNRAIPALSFIGGHGFIQFLADDLASQDADHVDFKLSGTSGETLRLFAANRSTVLETVTFGPQTLNVSQGRLPDGGMNFVWFRADRPTPGASNFLPLTNVVVNELLTHTDPPLEDAVELSNPTAQPVDVSHWWLSNDRDNPMRYRIPAGTVIPAGGFKVIYEYQFDPNDLGFTFNSYEPGEVVLCSGDASGALTGYRLSQAFGPAENGVSFGRYRTSRGMDFVAMSQRTFGMDTPAFLEQFRTGTGKTNAYPRLGPVLINELMYHPPDQLIAGQPEDNADDEYIELFNATDAPTPLFDPQYPTNQWRIRGGVSFNFPPGVTLPAHAWALVVGFDPADATQLTAFRAKYDLPSDVLILGPYSGKLDNRGEAIELLKPDPPQAPDRPKPGLVPYLLVDRVDYEDRDPWPDSPDGGADSLQRRSSIVYGNDPVHWLGAPPTPGRANAVEAPRLESATWTTHGFAFQFTAKAGVPYVAEWLANLAGANPVTLTNIAPALDPRTIPVNDAAARTNDLAKFYRLRIPSSP
jgi:hypothetical protein